MNHGGARKGAGRPRKADSRILVNFTLSPQTVHLLRTQVSARHRSMFVEAAILVALHCMTVRQIGSPISDQAEVR
jgi:hypothetical protein